MKILVTVDPEIPVPPEFYGGIERIADSLIAKYASEGHQVYLLANKGSTSAKAKQIIGWKRARSGGILNILLNSFQLLLVCFRFKPDVVHSFSRLLYLYPLFFFTKVKIVQSYQRAISQASTLIAGFFSFKKLTFTACGAHLFKNIKCNRPWHAIHNFADSAFYKPIENPSLDYIAFLGRIEDIKGTKEAIEVALKSDSKIIVAGNIPHEHQSYFDREIAPLLKSDLVSYIGPVGDEQKLKLLQNAKVMLFPIKWEEPFGIVMAEAMACGTPVIGFDRGSVNEVIINGRNGFKVNSVNGMVDALSKTEAINRHIVRNDAEERFSLNVIGDKYLTLFSKLV